MEDGFQPVLTRKEKLRLRKKALRIESSDDSMSDTSEEGKHSSIVTIVTYMPYS